MNGRSLWSGCPAPPPLRVCWWPEGGRGPQQRATPSLWSQTRPHLAWSTAGVEEALRGLGAKPHVRTPLNPPDSSEPAAASPGSLDGEGTDPGLCGPGPGHWAESLPEPPAGSPDLVCSLVIILETLFVPLQGGRRGAVERRAPPFKRRLERFCGL